MRVMVTGLVVLSAACGQAAAPLPAPQAPKATAPASSVTEIEAAQVAPASDPTPRPAATTREIPSDCADPNACALPSAFVETVCKKKFTDLPLYLFATKLPWKHLYVKAEYVEPVNPYGGEQSETWLKFGEEVVLLRRRVPGGVHAVQISGPTDVDVLRWDGTCATIREEMLVSYVPARCRARVSSGSTWTRARRTAC